jgi:ubiquinone/menaquinone biosynthesis C-methylase UbiE
MANTSSVIAAFTEMAARYEQTVDRELRQFWGLGYEEFIAQLIDQVDLRAAGSVLDVATGRGVIPLTLARERAWAGRVVGLDITPGMLQGASAQFAGCAAEGRIALVCGSGMQLPFSGGVFDTVICALATHHMDTRVLLQELKRVLRPGGQALIADVALAQLFRALPGRLLLRTLAWWYGRREGAARLQAEMEAVPNMLTPEQWRRELVAAGFCDLEMKTIPACRPWYPPGILATAFAGNFRGATQR